jgi:methylmalonyl-CoA/ethylmalonyl-CoA epimerase
MLYFYDKENKMAVTFDHLGIVVRDIDAAVKTFSEMLGLTPWDKGVVEDADNGVRLLSLPTGSTFIELIQPTRSDNRFARFLEERGEGLFHLCFFTEEFDKEIESWKEKGYSPEIETANAFPGNPFRLAWLSPESANGVWIELSDAAAIPGHIRNHKF